MLRKIESDKKSAEIRRNPQKYPSNPQKYPSKNTPSKNTPSKNTRSYKDILRFALGKELKFASIKTQNVLY